MRRYLILLLAGVLAGCATTRDSISLPPLDGWGQRMLVLSGLAEWEFHGRIGVRAGDEGFNGKIRWIQNQASFTATVGGPIGIGTVRIAGDADTVTLTDTDGIETELGDAEQELFYRYGWTIPIRSLRFWALGVPDPSTVAETAFDDDGLLTTLKQGGWNVQYTRYREGGGQPMPNRLTAVNADTRVRLVVDRWYFFK